MPKLLTSITFFYVVDLQVERQENTKGWLTGSILTGKRAVVILLQQLYRSFVTNGIIRCIDSV